MAVIKNSICAFDVLISIIRYFRSLLLQSVSLFGHNKSKKKKK